MRDDAARALRVDDDLPGDWAELRSIGSLLEVDLPPKMRRFQRDTEVETDAPAPVAAAVVALPERPAPERRPRERLAEKPVAPRTAPGRAYGSHRRADGPVAPRQVTGAQPGRRTVEITGQVQPRRRPSQTSAALVANPDRVALWAFLFALFLLAMAIATAHG